MLQGWRRGPGGRPLHGNGMRGEAAWRGPSASEPRPGEYAGPQSRFGRTRRGGVWRQGLRQSGRRVVLASQPSAEQMRVARPRGAVRAGRAHRSRGRAASHRPRRGRRGDARVWRRGRGLAMWRPVKCWYGGGGSSNRKRTRWRPSGGRERLWRLGRQSERWRARLRKPSGVTGVPGKVPQG